MKEFGIGIDIGGTSIKFGLFNKQGELIHKWDIVTDISDGGKNVIRDIADSIKEVLSFKSISMKDVVAIGMGVPGVIVGLNYVKVCVNLGWRDMHPADELSKLLDGVDVYLGNDANVAALGEVWQGAAKDYENVLMITLGTGVGGGVIIDGKIVSGAHGLGGEIGHIKVEKEEAKLCNCNASGCLEQYASATGIVSLAMKSLSLSDKASVLRDKADLSAKDVLDAAKLGDSVALEVMDKVTDYLGMAISNISLVINPQSIVIGGGVSNAGDFLISMIYDKYDNYLKLSEERATIIAAKLGNDAGIYGAAKLALDNALA